MKCKHAAIEDQLRLTRVHDALVDAAYVSEAGIRALICSSASLFGTTTPIHSRLLARRFRQEVLLCVEHRPLECSSRPGRPVNPTAPLSRSHPCCLWKGHHTSAPGPACRLPRFSVATAPQKGTLSSVCLPWATDELPPPAWCGLDPSRGGVT